VFGKLNIPLALHRSVGSNTYLEYLGIILDSENMIAKLPYDKLCRIKDLLYVFLDRRTCRDDLRMWYAFLDQWNGISFLIKFY
jgi:hypothetical protein